MAIIWVPASAWDPLLRALAALEPVPHQMATANQASLHTKHLRALSRMTRTQLELAEGEENT